MRRLLAVTLSSLTLLACTDDVSPIALMWKESVSAATERLGNEANSLEWDARELSELVTSPDDPEAVALRAHADVSLKEATALLAGVKAVVTGRQGPVDQALAQKKASTALAAVQAAKADVDQAMEAFSLKRTQFKAELAALRAHVEETVNLARLKAKWNDPPEVEVTIPNEREDFTALDFTAADAVAVEDPVVARNVEALVQVLQSCAQLKVALEVHAGSGDEASAKAQTERRAKALGALLTSKKVGRAVAKVTGLGVSKPSEPTPSPGPDYDAQLAEVRAHNERVTLEVLTPCPRTRTTGN